MRTVAARIRSSVLAALLTVSMATGAGATCFRGVNLSGAEFGGRGGTYGQDYIYPSERIVAYMAAKGFNTVRLPFLWERLQPALGGPLDAAELARLEEAVATIRAAGLAVILDPHNYAAYDDRRIGSRAVPDTAFADFWRRLAAVFANRPGVSFGLMNEPNAVAARRWLKSANAALAAIRATGAGNLVLVPGTDWSGAHSWRSRNAGAMIAIEDPADNFAYEVHQYLDDDFSGTHAACSRADDAVAAIEAMSEWLRANDARGFLGEFGAGGSAECLTGLARMVEAVNAADDVWTGWTYWVAGDWWPPDEPLNITPTPGGDRVQIKALQRPGLNDENCAGL